MTAHRGCVTMSDGPLRSDAQLALPLQPEQARPLSSHEPPSDAAALLDSDEAARASALDTDHSFIVRAPAGSGKTELITRQLAQRVAARDRDLRWQLASNPARLRVQTIDALALWIARQLPITTRFAAITQLPERAEALYDAAAHATLALIDSAEEQNSGIALHVVRLLTHLDNDWPRAHRLLSGMLARRDQWLRHVGRLDRAALEAPMQNACTAQIERVCEV